MAIWDTLKTGISEIGSYLTGNKSGYDYYKGCSTLPTKSNTYYPKSTSVTTTPPVDYSALLKSLSTYQAPVAIPSLSLTNIYNKARAQAEAAVNPWFSTQLANYTKQRDLAKKKALESYTSTTNEAKLALEKALQETATGRVRAEEDTATNLANIAGEETNRQRLEALQYDQARRGLQENLGESGLTTSGLGRQQLAEEQKVRNLTETEQKRVVEANVKAQNLAKTRTIADLASSEDWAKKGHAETVRSATQTKKLAEEQANFDLELNKLDAEIKRMEMVNTSTRGFEQQQWRDYLSGLSSAQRERASSIYGGYF